MLLGGCGGPVVPCSECAQMAVAPVLQCAPLRTAVALAPLLFLRHCCKGSASPCSPSCFDLASASLLLEGFCLYFCC